MLFLDGLPRISLFSFYGLVYSFKDYPGKGKARDFIFRNILFFSLRIGTDVSFWAWRVYSLHTILWCKCSVRKDSMGMFLSLLINFYRRKFLNGEVKNWFYNLKTFLKCLILCSAVLKQPKKSVWVIYISCMTQKGKYYVIKITNFAVLHW